MSAFLYKQDQIEEFLCRNKRMLRVQKYLYRLSPTFLQRQHRGRCESQEEKQQALLPSFRCTLTSDCCHRSLARIGLSIHPHVPIFRSHALALGSSNNSYQDRGQSFPCLSLCEPFTPFVGLTFKVCNFR
jgi:hypothetical protein